MAQPRSYSLQPLSAGNDSYTGGAGNDTLTGGNGTDTLVGNGGDDVLIADIDTRYWYAFGDEGTYNYLFAGAGNDTLLGGAGDDRLFGQGDNDVLDGWYGDDSVDGGIGNDVLTGGEGDDTLLGGDGNDTISGFDYGNDVIDGGGGDDIVRIRERGAYNAGVTITLGAGADRIEFQTDPHHDETSVFDISTLRRPLRITDFDLAGGDRISAYTGLGGAITWQGDAAAAFTATVGQSVSLAGPAVAGPDIWRVYDAANALTILYCDTNNNGVVDLDDLRLEFVGDVALGAEMFEPATTASRSGTQGDDSDTTVPLGTGNDQASALGGNDTLAGLQGNDTLNGDAGNDELHGDAGLDLLDGGVGDDVLHGGAHEDDLRGNLGMDSLYGGDGNDTLRGDGTDEYYSPRDAAGTLNALYGEAGDDSLRGGYGDDVLSGGDGADSLFGGIGHDALDGGLGNDVIYVDTGDTARGGDGVDDIHVLAGVTVYGDAGADIFHFSSDSYYLRDSNIDRAPTTVADTALIADFSGAAGDRLDLLNPYTVFSGILVWRGTAPTGFLAQAGEAVPDAGGTGTLDFWTGYDATLGHTFIFVDSNGNGVVDGNDFRVDFSGAVTPNRNWFKLDTYGRSIFAGGTAGTAEGDTLVGGVGSDTFFGAGGDDLLQGDAGNDALYGGSNDDTVDGGDGDDMVMAGLGDDSVLGGAGNDALYGGSGVDTIRGGDGNDSISGAAYENTGLEWALADANFLFGDTGNDTLYGGAGSVLDGGADNDILNSASGTSEAGTSMRGGAGDDRLIGYYGADTMDGGLGSDSIDGGQDSDLVLYDAADTTVSGGAGIDTLVLTTGEVVNLANGTDQVAGGGTAIQFEHVDGSAAISALVLSGNGVDNRLIGGAAGDSLNGLGGADILDGRGGNDTLVGSDGSDIYFVDSAADVTIESSANAVTGGIDEVVSTAAAYVLGANIENLRLAGTGPQAATGNAGVNTIWAGAGDNVIDGGGGADTVSYLGATGGITLSLALASAQATGGSGTDTLLAIENASGSQYADALTGTDTANRLLGNASADTLVGLGGIDTLDGGEGDDLLAGNAGDDYLVGGGGNDTASYAAALGAVMVSLAAPASQDTGSDGLDTLVGIENLIGGQYSDTLTGDGAANRLDGGAGNDTLDGGAGADTVVGGTGDDTFLIAAHDTVLELADGGVDTVVTALASYTLGAGLENLQLTAATAANGFGNALDNTLYAGAGANVLNGGAGIDTVSYAFATAGVSLWLAQITAQATGGSGNDTLLNIENLAGSAYADILRGNSVSNRLDGGAGADSLSGGGGNDALLGGLGNDTLDGGVGDDQLDGGAQVDTVSYATATAGVTVDLALTTEQATGGAGNDTLLGFENVNGGAHGDWLRGNALANRLNGGSGADSLSGGVGSDMLIGGLGADTFAYNATDESIAGARDTVFDFNHAQGDRIDLTAMDADSVVDGDQAFQFIGSAAFSADATGQLRYDAGTGLLYASVDADATAEFVVLLVGNPALTAADILL